MRTLASSPNFGDRVIGRKNMRLRSWLGVMVMSAVLAVNGDAWAQSYPDRPVRMLIAFPGGGTIDTLGRILAQKLTEAWGQNVVIENRPGAAGNIGAAAAAKSAPDGYTLHFGAQTLAVNVTLQPSKEFDPVKDFDPIMLVATAQDVLVVPLNSPFHSVKELIDYAKAHPGELNYASLGTGTSGHLATVMFSDLAGIKLQHVPYTSVSQAATDVISGRIEVFLPTLGGHIGNVTAGRMRALAVSGAGARRAASRCPDLQRARRKVRGRDQLVRAVRAQGHAGGDHRQGQRRRRTHPGDAGRQGEGSDARLSLRRRLYGEARRLPQERDRQVGRGRPKRLTAVTFSSSLPIVRTADAVCPLPRLRGRVGEGEGIISSREACPLPVPPPPGGAGTMEPRR